MPPTVFVPATDKQIEFLAKLMGEKNGLDAQGRANFIARMKQLAAQRNPVASKKEVSKTIDTLLRQVPEMPKPPEGRYALVNGNDNKLYFFLVEEGQGERWAGYTFVTMLSGDNHIKVDQREARMILGAIASDPLGAARRYGREIKRCARCHRRLTDEESRKAGIGPECIKHYQAFELLESDRQMDAMVQQAEREEDERVAAYKARRDGF